MPSPPLRTIFPLILFLTATLYAQTPTRPFHDPIYHLSFDYPANWTFSHTDHEISTFHLDARSAPRNARLRAVVSMPENPFPASTFSGAYMYFSVMPRATAASCTRQAGPPADVSHKSTESVTLADLPFTRGRDEQFDICTTQHDEIYTTLHRGACYRFDLAINNFCSAGSGVRDISARELDQVRSRLDTILNTVRFDPR